MRQSRLSIHDLCAGRWKSLLVRCGVPAKHLTGKNGPCPLCGGKDRFRWTNYNDSGGFLCNVCGNGTGVDLVMRVRGVSFMDAKNEIERWLPVSEINTSRRADAKDLNAKALERWLAAEPLDGTDPASRYLISRGLRLSPWPAMLRWTPRAVYWGEGGERSEHPAMLARFVSADGKTSTVHVTYLTRNGLKADVPKAKKMSPGPIPVGGAIRLSHSAETMGVAEGIETALSAMVRDDVPVWSTYSAGNLVKFVPPPHVKCLIIYADNDRSYAGASAAYALAHLLTQQRKVICEVRMPDAPDTDWNDVLMSEQQVRGPRPMTHGLQAAE